MCIGVNFTPLHDTARSPPMYFVIADLFIRVGKKGTESVNVDNAMFDYGSIYISRVVRSNFEF